eukprot:gnl/MRDRNA2_/MRDRNA2_33723_c0_seq1.p1 gnl/MRDRNA2_/MRDRNA2_33723_c0~~gnl/MRDRNA2_/MRDRNA2_33723_c0_seq1.p1  ORF type:complete len:573 (-),score=63.14 gnl/MRDRNA2_/MRDRNA2_33723_c0_seq1:245-1963(-)
MALEELQEQPICRICLCGDEVEKLVHPCQCKGSMEWVHSVCLCKWIAQRNSTTMRCDVCRAPFLVVGRSTSWAIAAAASDFLRTHPVGVIPACVLLCSALTFCGLCAALGVLTVARCLYLRWDDMDLATMTLERGMSCSMGAVIMSILLGMWCFAVSKLWSQIPATSRGKCRLLFISINIAMLMAWHSAVSQPQPVPLFWCYASELCRWQLPIALWAYAAVLVVSFPPGTSPPSSRWMLFFYWDARNALLNDGDEDDPFARTDAVSGLFIVFLYNEIFVLTVNSIGPGQQHVPWPDLVWSLLPGMALLSFFLLRYAHHILAALRLGVQHIFAAVSGALLHSDSAARELGCGLVTITCSSGRAICFLMTRLVCPPAASLASDPNAHILYVTAALVCFLFQFNQILDMGRLVHPPSKSKKDLFGAFAALLYQEQAWTHYLVLVLVAHLLQITRGLSFAWPRCSIHVDMMGNETIEPRPQQWMVILSYCLLPTMVNIFNPIEHIEQQQPGSETGCLRVLVLVWFVSLVVLSLLANREVVMGFWTRMQLQYGSVTFLGRTESANEVLHEPLLNSSP